MNKKQRNLCPFCFHKSDKWEEYWYCPHCKELNSKEQDGKLPIKCPKCEKPVSESDINIKMRVCTNCKSIVPKEFDECDEIFPIAVVGPTRSGKTHFLTVMAHKLLEEKIWGDYWSAVRVIRQEIVTTMGVKKSTQRDDYLNFDEILYNPNTHDTLQGTDLDAKICSLLIELTYKRGVVNCFKEPWKKKKILLALSDTAGEGLNRQHWSEITDRYPIFNNHVKAVIAMVDPLELSKISDEAKDKDLQTEYINMGIWPEDGSMPKITARGVMSNPIFEKRMEHYPVAWCMTKTYALMKLTKIIKDTTLEKSQGALSGDDGTSKTSGKVMIEGVDGLEGLCEVSEQTKNFIEVHGGEKFPTDYGYHCYFAVDALGESYHDGVRHGLPQPRRILDPLLWILWQYGLCGGR